MEEGKQQTFGGGAGGKEKKNMWRSKKWQGQPIAQPIKKQDIHRPKND